MRAAVYCRLSRKPETDENIQQQEVRGLALVADNRWTLIRDAGNDRDAFIDDGVSAYKPDAVRPAWNALLERCAAGDVDVIVARDSDRLSRNWDDFARLVRSGAKVSTWAEGSGQPADPDDTEGAVRAMMSRSYSKALSRNRALAEERRVAAGKAPPGGHRHFGYHLYCCPAPDCELAENHRTLRRRQRLPVPGGRPRPCCQGSCNREDVWDDEAEIIRSVAGRWLAGEPLRALARDLNERHIRTTAGGQWTRAALKRTLLSPRLAGIRLYTPGASGVPEEHDGDWLPIFSRELHLRLVAADSRSGNRRAPDRYLLTGLLFCGRCSDPHEHEDVWVRLNGHMHRPGKPRYACLSCRRNGIGASSVETALWNETLGREWTRNDQGERQAATRLAEIEQSLGVTREALDELDDDYWQRRAVEKRTYTRQATALRDRMRGLEGERERLRNERQQNSGFWSSLLDMVETYETATPEQKRALLEGAIRRVTLRPAVKPSGPRVDIGRLEVEWRDGLISSLTDH